jgi:hypothetical protein
MAHSETNKTKAPKNLVLSRLNNPKIWGRELFIFAFSFNIILTITMDVVRLDSISWLWFVPFAVTFAIATLLGFFASKIVAQSRDKRFVWVLNLILAAIIGSIKNVAVGLLADWLNLANDATVAYRAFAGAVMGVTLVFFLSMSIGARAAHREAVNTLINLQAGLVGRKKRLEQTVADENLKLVQATNDILIPKLRNIEELLSQGDRSHLTVQALRATIERDIRPLTRNIEAPVLRTSILRPEDRQVKVRKIRFPKRISLVPAISPVSSLVFNVISFGMLMFFLKGFVGVLYADITVSIEVLLLVLVKRFLSTEKKSSARALVQLCVISVLCSLPNFILVWMTLGLESPVSVPIAMVLVISVGSALGSAYSSVLDSERLRVEQEIANENQELAHEIALYEQKIWVFRKSWQLLLHGTVQAALTTALTRLTLPADDEVLQAAMVRQDLARAEVALQATPVRELDLHRCIAELSSGWRGVCDVRIKASERAARALKRSFELMFGVNEIMREAVSNAVRHASATEIEIEIDRESDDVLLFQARNNGIPLAGKIIKGMGSQMMDDLTLTWSLTQDARSRKTLLRASIPVSI